MATSPPPGNPSEDIVTAEELGAFLKVDPHTVLNWAKAGIIPEAFRLGRTVRFSLDAVKASLDVNNAGEGRFVEIVSLALQNMLGIDYARMPNIDPDFLTARARERAGERGGGARTTHSFPPLVSRVLRSPSGRTQEQRRVVVDIDEAGGHSAYTPRFAQLFGEFEF